MSHFKLVTETTAFHGCNVKKLVSNKTGLRVIVGDVEGITIHGSITIVTESQNDEGIAHALEHLIFSGSKKYPYTDVINEFVNTVSAYSEPDQICYTFTVVGQNNALTVLPIYFKHVMFPLLDDRAYTFYVHHIDGDGKDGGLVYDEMKEPEYYPYKSCVICLLKEMYPNSGYSSDSAGSSELVRTSLNFTKIKDFHKKFFRLDNMMLVITGQIDLEALLTTVADIEHDILKQTTISENREKPWQTIPSPPNYGEYNVYWPDDVEDEPLILFGWRGPIMGDRTSQKEMLSLEATLRYICDNPAGLIYKYFDKKLAKFVHFNSNDVKYTHIRIEVHDVHVDNLQSARDEIIKSIKNIKNDITCTDIDQIKNKLMKECTSYKQNIDLNLHYEIMQQCVFDLLHSEKEEDFIDRMNLQTIIQDAIEEPKQYWVDLLNKYFTDDVVIVIGQPDDTMRDKLNKNEEKIINDRIKELGTKGLAEKARLVEEANNFVRRPLPMNIVELVSLPPVDTIQFPELRSWPAAGGGCPHFNVQDLPFYARVQNLATTRLYMHIILDTTELDNKYRRWLPILVALLERQYPRDVLPAGDDEVIHQLSLQFDCNLGFDNFGYFGTGAFGNYAHIQIECLPETYEKTVNKLYDILYGADITVDSVLTVARQMMDQICDSGNYHEHRIMNELTRDALYSESSNAFWCSQFRQKFFLTDLILKLKLSLNIETIMTEVKTAYAAMTQAIWIQIATDFTAHKLSAEVWKKFSRGLNNLSTTIPKLYSDADLMGNWGGGFVVGMETVKEPCLIMYGRGPLTQTTGFNVALKIALSYFKQVCLKKKYPSLDISYSESERCIILEVPEVKDAADAYTDIKYICNTFISSHSIDIKEFKTAKKNIIYEYLDKESYHLALVRNSLMNFISQTGMENTKEILKMVSDMNWDSVMAEAVEWLPTLFDMANNKLTIICHTEEVQSVQEQFKRLGVNINAFTHVNEIIS